MTIEEMRNRKIELGFTNKVLAERAGVPLGTVQKIFSGETKAPRQATLKALQNVLAPTHLYTVSNSCLPALSGNRHRHTVRNIADIPWRITWPCRRTGGSN